jgi:formamidase
VYVEDAEPGDALQVEVVGIEPGDFGWTCITPGFGLLSDLFPEPYLMKWEVGRDVAHSSDLPGVEIPNASFPGIVGVAPSHALVDQIRRREHELRRRRGTVAEDAPEAARPERAAGGLRTVPPRENGGNMDVRQLRVGSRITLPVYVPGALLSVGDVHYAMGEGEVCGTALETTGAVTLRVEVVKRPRWRSRYPMYETVPEGARRCIATTGIPVTLNGRNEDMDIALAARTALLEMIDYLTVLRGFSRSAAYCLSSVAADLRLSEVVDAPNPLVSALLPLDIFVAGT